MLADSELRPGQRLGDYRIIRQLGAGGMGTVYQAEHERIARPVAIKVLRPELTQNPEAAARFLNGLRGGSWRREMATWGGPGSGQETPSAN